jgi:hypothetical protein
MALGARKGKKKRKKKEETKRRFLLLLKPAHTYRYRLFAGRLFDVFGHDHGPSPGHGLEQARNRLLLGGRLLFFFFHSDLIKRYSWPPFPRYNIPFSFASCLYDFLMKKKKKKKGSNLF